MSELPETKEIINVLLSFGESIDETLINYHHSVYDRKITAMYYDTDGLIEYHTTISIFVSSDVILVQIDDDDVCTYDRFKEAYYG